jgi:hypothetical protein
MATGGLADAVGRVGITPLDEAVRATVDHFRRAA